MRLEIGYGAAKQHDNLPVVGIVLSREDQKEEEFALVGDLEQLFNTVVRAIGLAKEMRKNPEHFWSFNDAD